MAAVWAAFKKSLNCKTGDSCCVREESQSYTGGKKSAAAAELRRSGCSRSIANLRGVIHSQYGSSRRQEAAPAPARASCEVGVRCHRCGDRFANLDALESHHLSRHAVTELVEGDSSRKVVEIICKAGWTKSENALGRVERVVKVHNAGKSVARFEEFREMVKGRAAKLPKKHPRCLADGNELLRFHGTTLSCSLGAGDSSRLCTSGTCSVCRIIRHGFSATREVKDGVGVFTTSTSKQALECIQETAGGKATGVKKALLVCRVIAGRIHRPLENLQDVAAQPGFDSVAGKVGAYASIEELYLLNPRALLPCFVVICKS
ncbi:hypothetical protein ABZP36_012334 [Zizania latifolia]